MPVFKPRAPGTTSARPALSGNYFRRRLNHAVVDPHDASERFDPDFLLGLVCSVCGRAGMAPRKHVQEAIREHVEAKHSGDDRAVAVAVMYPKQ